MSYAVHLTLKSGNGKTGPIPVSTTSRSTCPDACPLKDNGCYADLGPLGLLWSVLSAAEPGALVKRTAKATLQTLTWSQFTDAISQLEDGTFWRHNQAGDLPGLGDEIDEVALDDLVEANKGKRGFTYTHKPLTKTNKAAIKRANKQGFTINLSADNLKEADQLSAAKVGPVVVVLPKKVHGHTDITTPKGRKVVVCPATYRDDVSCDTCQLCQRQERKVIVGFPAHGTRKKKASAIAEGRSS